MYLVLGYSEIFIWDVGANLLKGCVSECGSRGKAFLSFCICDKKNCLNGCKK